MLTPNYTLGVIERRVVFHRNSIYVDYFSRGTINSEMPDEAAAQGGRIRVPLIKFNEIEVRRIPSLWNAKEYERMKAVAGSINGFRRR